MNKIGSGKDDELSLNTSLKSYKKKNLITSASDNNVKNIPESAFKNNASLDIKKEFLKGKLHVAANSKNVGQNNGDISKKNKKSLSLKKKRFLKSSNNENESKKCDSAIKTLNDDSTSDSLNLYDNDVNNFQISCQFCRKDFETPEHFDAHECKKEKSNSNLTVHKCEFCSVTFSKKYKLDRHVKGHNRNNCTMCNAYFTKRKALCKHLKFEHNIIEPEKLHPCSFCSKNFGNKSSLNTHLKSHANGQHFCLKCGFMCVSEDTYNDHLKEHIKNSKYECHLCEKRFVRRQQYDQHMMGHERHSCSLCNITYSTKKLLLKHRQSEHGACISVKKHECPICKKMFLRPKHLQTHQRSHTGEKPVKCSHCEKLFCDERSLSKHMKTVKHLQRVNNDEGKVIEIEKPFLCSECGARFYRKQSLFRHVEVKHTASESFKCPHCDYNTKCKTNYKRHTELHSDIKRFICEICGSSFRAFASLKEHHAFVHSENRGFICDVCNKGFKNKSTLLRHLRIHSEVRPYKCYCDRDYKRMSHLKRHMISAHHMALKKNQIPAISESTNLSSSVKNENLVYSFESIKMIPDESSCDDFSLIAVPNNTIYIELNGSNINKTASNEQFPASAEADNFIDVPSNSMQTLLDKTVTDEESKSTLITLLSDSCAKTSPLCLPPDPDTSNSMSLDDPNLNLSPNTFCNFNLASSPLSSLPIDNVTSNLVHSVTSQDVLSFPSSPDSQIRPHSLPNLNFQTSTSISSVDSFTPFSLRNSESPTSLQISSFLLNGDMSSPSHVTDLNLEQNNSSKQLFGDSGDILSLPPYTSNNNQLSGVNCSSDQLFSPGRDLELWDSVDCSNRLKIPDGELVTTNACSSFSTNVTSNVCNLLNNSLMISNDTFEDPTLISYPLDTITLNTEFDTLSNLC